MKEFIIMIIAAALTLVVGSIAGFVLFQTTNNSVLAMLGGTVIGMLIYAGAAMWSISKQADVETLDEITSLPKSKEPALRG